VTRSNARWRGWAPRAALVAAVGLVSVGLTGCVPPKSYVALGDSYASGPLIPVQQTNPAGCLRSDHNYPHVVRPHLTLPVFRDVSCSGADTTDMTAAQSITGGANAPQFDALDAGTAAVSLTIGGNDIGFTSIIGNCISATNTGTPCHDHYMVNGRDQISALIAAAAVKVRAVLAGIHSRSPLAKIFVVGYLDILPDNGRSCYPQMPITAGDEPYLRDKEKELNSMLQTTADGNGAIYVDAYAASVGHDACQLPAVRWVEPLAPIGAAPVHPNSSGMLAAGTVLLAAMRARGL
jgi:hypothetical protein